MWHGLLRESAKRISIASGHEEVEQPKALEQQMHLLEGGQGEGAAVGGRRGAGRGDGREWPRRQASGGRHAAPGQVHEVEAGQELALVQAALISRNGAPHVPERVLGQAPLHEVAEAITALRTHKPGVQKHSRLSPGRCRHFNPKKSPEHGAVISTIHPPHRLRNSVSMQEALVRSWTHKQRSSAWSQDLHVAVPVSVQLLEGGHVALRVRSRHGRERRRARGCGSGA